MMNVSEKAAEKALDMFKEKGLPADTGLRVFVVGGGCSGYQYGMALARDVDAEDRGGPMFGSAAYWYTLHRR